MEPYRQTLLREKVDTQFDNYEWEVFANEAVNKIEFLVQEDIWDWLAEESEEFLELWLQRPYSSLVSTSNFTKSQVTWEWVPDESGTISKEAWVLIAKAIDVFITYWFENGGMGNYHDMIESIEELKQEYGPPQESLDW